jgi:hypothetical protein
MIVAVNEAGPAARGYFAKRRSVTPQLPFSHLFIRASGNVTP